MKKPCMVIYDDENGLMVPHGWNPKCKGALECMGGDDLPVLFPDRKAARKAIAISVAFNKLLKAQGLPPNTDYTESIKHIKVIDVEIAL